MKNAILFVTTFGIGIGLGVLLHRSLVESPAKIKASSSPSQFGQPWNENENDTRRRMAAFQDRLEHLEKQPTPDSIDRLARDMEAQRGIDDILIKYREAQQAKFTAFSSIIGASVTAIIGAVGGWLAAKRTSKSSSAGAQEKGLSP